jgi:hypothetical protein
MESAAGPDKRNIAIAPCPTGVEIAAIVSSLPVISAV